MRLAVLLATGLLAACSGAPAAPPADRVPDGSRSGQREAAPTPAPVRYVALGDSFTSGPFVPVTDLASGCLRSSGNYPSLLARRLRAASFVDVSCAGAGTADLTGGQRTLVDARVPPQLDAVEADTTLVTVGVGGNDAGLFARLTGACLGAAPRDRAGAPCRAAVAELERERALASTGRDVMRVLLAVRRRAPDARVVLVGYPRIAPRAGGCPGRLPHTGSDLALVDDVQRALNDALRRAADRARSDFLDMYAASRGHDVCARAPYVQGVRTDRSRALALHPLPRGMRAVAAELAGLLEAR